MFGAKIDVLPPHSQNFADADAGGEHEVDDVGQVAGVPRSRLTASGLLPLPAADNAGRGREEETSRP